MGWVPLIIVYRLLPPRRTLQHLLHSALTPDCHTWAALCRRSSHFNTNSPALGQLDEELSSTTIYGSHRGPGTCYNSLGNVQVRPLPGWTASISYINLRRGATQNKPDDSHLTYPGLGKSRPEISSTLVSQLDLKIYTFFFLPISVSLPFYKNTLTLYL